MSRNTLDISWTSLIRIAGLLLGAYLVWRLRIVLLLLAGVFIFVAAANPIITRWGRRMKRQYATTLFLVAVLATLGALIGVLIPALAVQLSNLASEVPVVSDRLGSFIDQLQQANRNAELARQAVDLLRSGVGQLPTQIVASARLAINVLVSVITVVFLSYYLLLEEKNARDFFHQILPADRYVAVYETVQKIADRLGSWVRSQLTLMVIVGLMNLVIYLAIGMSSPLPLALWAGLAEIIPLVGPIIGAVPALIISLLTGNILQAVLIVVLAVGLVQQIENYFIVPRMVGRSVGLSPVLVIMALLIGGTLFGLAGALLAVPAAATIAVVVSEWPNLKRLWEPNA